MGLKKKKEKRNKRNSLQGAFNSIVWLGFLECVKEKEDLKTASPTVMFYLPQFSENKEEGRSNGPQKQWASETRRRSSIIQFQDNT